MNAAVQERSDWTTRAVTTNIDTDFSKTFSFDEEDCDLQVKKEFKIPAIDSKGDAATIVCSKSELDNLFVGIYVLLDIFTNFHIRGLTRPMSGLLY